MSKLLTRKDLLALVDDWLEQGVLAAAPTRAEGRRTAYDWIGSSDQWVLDGCVHPVNSIKAFFFPPHETLYRYRREGSDVALAAPTEPAGRRIVVGARPCDAAALPMLDGIFGAEPGDPSYRRRRELTCVVTLACSESDEHCFCTSLGFGPECSLGSDVMLLPLDGETFEVRTFSPKGEALLAGRCRESNRRGRAAAAPQAPVDIAAVRRFLADRWDDARWPGLGRRCLGCGVCTYSCPTCHCFDIADEPLGTQGARVRNWDSCQFGMFTLHASGHNPRTRQWQRQRQRIYHKFHVFKEKFGYVACTGCGTCPRNCPVHLGTGPILEEIAGLETGAAGLGRLRPENLLADEPAGPARKEPLPRTRQANTAYLEKLT